MDERIADMIDDDMLPPGHIDAEALAFLDGLRDPNGRFLMRWKPRYRETIQAVAQALAVGRPQDLFDALWKRRDNAVADAGQGLLKYDVVNKLRNELVRVISDISENGSSENFESIRGTPLPQ